VCVTDHSLPNQPHFRRSFLTAMFPSLVPDHIRRPAVGVPNPFPPPQIPENPEALFLGRCEVAYVELAHKMGRPAHRQTGDPFVVTFFSPLPPAFKDGLKLNLLETLNQLPLGKERSSFTCINYKLSVASYPHFRQVVLYCPNRALRSADFPGCRGPRAGSCFRLFRLCHRRNGESSFRNLLWEFN
jgi:hypothetical protein